MMLQSNFKYVIVRTQSIPHITCQQVLLDLFEGSSSPLHIDVTDATLAHTCTHLNVIYVGC